MSTTTQLSSKMLTAENQSPVPPAAGVALCLLLAIAQIAIAGYQLGLGNQAIQVAFLQHLADPALFAKDPMVTQTIPLYPTYFFRLLAPLLHISALDPLYLMLQILTSFFTLSAVYLLSRSIFKNHTAALAAVALLVAGHHRALAGDSLYSAGFTHTFIALPIALAAIALAYRRHTLWAFALAGLLFNLHALTAAYAALMIAFATQAEGLQSLGVTKRIKQLALELITFAIFASPTLWLMAAHHQSFDAAWINLMRIRSAEHSFPGTWWATGNPDIPRITLLFALFVLSWSFSPVRQGGGGDTARALRITVLMTVAVCLLFAVGYIFTELVPIPLIIRLQPFRASRLLMILMFVHIAYSSVAGIRAGISGKTFAPDATQISLALPSRILEILAGLLTLCTLAIPSLLPLLPATVLFVLITALVSARLSVTQTLVALASLALAFIAWRHIQFPLPLLSPDLSLFPRQFTLDPLALIPLAAAAIIAILFSLLAASASRQHPLPLSPRHLVTLSSLLIAATLVLGAAATWQLFHHELEPDPSDKSPTALLAGVSTWARTSTPKDALFLAPTGLPGFRIFASRGLVADWRDGTQLYFSAAFGPDWLNRLTAIEPGLLLSPDGSRLVARGRPLDTLDDDELLALAHKYDAAYILLRTPARTNPRTLQIAYTDNNFTAFLPKIAPSPIAIPPGVINAAEWTAMEKFMGTTVQQNIEKYRKADLAIQIVDPQGRPVQDLLITLDQTNSSFFLGCSLSFFEPNNTDSLGDQKAPPVTAAELKLFPTLFNASMPAFSGKWMYLEPYDTSLVDHALALAQKTIPFATRWLTIESPDAKFSDLDRYINYCNRHDVAVEYHFLAGLLPKFLRKNDKLAAARFPDHAREIVDRYHDRVAFWQVTNDKYLLTATLPGKSDQAKPEYVMPLIFKELREKYPGIKLGLSDCMRFYSDAKDPHRRDGEMYKGFDAIPFLKSQGAAPDFFSIHGHYPIGLWADPRTMYEVFDKFQKENVKLHISEMFLPLGSDIAGPVRKGKWLPTLQADYLERFLTVCFSHPNVEMVNLWGMVPHGWGGSAGLVDSHMQPLPAFTRLQKLFRQTWRTHLETQLPLDGIVTTRAFHGSYQLTIQLPDHRTATATLTIPQTNQSTFKFTLNPATATLSPAP